MNYADFFLRGQDSDDFNSLPYFRKISSPILQDKKTANLFADCFSNHVDFDSPYTDELVFDQGSTTRFIKRDNLSSFFINHIYEIPDITNYVDDSPIDYADLLAEFAETSFYDTSERFNLGSNRIRYVVGDVGVGKSAFIKKVISDITLNREEIDSDYYVLPVYFNLEDKYNYAASPIPLKDKFLEHLFEKINESVANAHISIDLKEINEINPCNNQVLALKYLIATLKKNKVRLLIFIDNLDFYHYYYARYSFFSEYNTKQDDSIHENICWLRSVLTTNGGIGYLGLNIIIASRSYVYDEIMAKLSGIDTEIDTTLAIRLSLSSEEIVIGSRLNLLSKAIEIIIKNRPTMDRTLKELSVQLHTKLLSEEISTTTQKNNPIKTIYKLGQHGHRSLVQFFSSLNISYLDDDLINRFFKRQISTLYILYFNNMYKKYSQQQGHFPNIFLVDCTVMDGKGFEIAHQPHIHTYWLKYFILKYIYVKRNVRLDDLLEVFCRIGNYEEHLVRHVIGSLSTANEFRCVEIDTREIARPFSRRQIKITERGKALFSQNNEIELCFEFQYLSTIIDDMWLSYPKPFMDSIFKSKSDFSHLYETGDEYAKHSLQSVLEKAECLVSFINILEVAYNEEIKKRKSPLDIIIKQSVMKPDFFKIRSNIFYSAENLLNNISTKHKNDIKLAEIKEMSHKTIHDQSYQLFYESYFKSGVLVTS
jgi:hypothetical protein